MAGKRRYCSARHSVCPFLRLRQRKQIARKKSPEELDEDRLSTQGRHHASFRALYARKYFQICTESAKENATGLTNTNGASVRNTEEVSDVGQRPD